MKFGIFHLFGSQMRNSWQRHGIKTIARVKSLQEAKRGLQKRVESYNLISKIFTISYWLHRLP